VIPKGLVSNPVVRAIGQGDRQIMLKALAAGMRGLGGGRRTKVVAVGRGKWTYHSFVRTDAIRRCVLYFIF